MRAKEGRGKFSNRDYSIPESRNVDENRLQWNQRNAVARADAARQRIEKKQENGDE